ncbi:unnamed protein product [Mytilus edulis]|uniref:Uncharacterized protein n=1 Tax=Mytilus edulis TaxID=6550 RepID=A0A8S3QH03_MYTED|nr:unnamed protein product [Mytilus edulis]
MTSILPTSHIDTVATSHLVTSILPTSHIDTVTTSHLVTSILPTSHIDTTTVIASQGITCTSSPTTVCSDETTHTAEETTEPTHSKKNPNNLTCFSFCYHNKYHKNLTTEHVQNIRDEIRQFLLVDIKTLSSQIRKKISVRDRRTSATIIGSIPMSIMLAVIGCVILSDLNIIRIHLYGMVKNIKGLFCFIRR